MDTDIVLVGSGTMAHGYFTAARRLGLRLGLVDVPERLVAADAEFGELVADREAVDPRCAGRDEAWVGPALALARRTHAQGVLAFSETHVLAAAYAAESLDLPGVGLHAAHLSRNKALQRQVYAAAGIPQPASALVPQPADIDEPAFPVVVKPLSGAGSSGVELVSHRSCWTDLVQRRGHDGPLLVEQYATGREYSWEALVHQGEVLFTNLTAKTTTGPPHFVELSHVPLLGADTEPLRHTADRVGAQVVDAMRVRDGLVHLEFRLPGPSTPSVMETAVRTPGDFIMEAVSRAHGFDLHEACLRLAMGKRPDAQPVRQAPRHTASLFLVAGGAGVVVPAHVDALRAVPGVVRAGLRQEPGSLARPPRSSGDRVAFALLDCATDRDLRLAIDHAATALPLVSSPSGLTSEVQP